MPCIAATVATVVCIKIVLLVILLLFVINLLLLASIRIENASAECDENEPMWNNNEQSIDNEAFIQIKEESYLSDPMQLKGWMEKFETAKDAEAKERVIKLTNEFLSKLEESDKVIEEACKLYQQEGKTAPQDFLTMLNHSQ